MAIKGCSSNRAAFTFYLDEYLEIHAKSATIANMLSIIIPTLNEEEYLVKLLQSIQKQDYQDFEIIVADAGSQDRTIEIAKEYGCKIVEGGLPGPGRNKGARVAQGSLLFFVDADVEFPEGAFQKILQEFSSRELGVASFLLLAKKRTHRIIFHAFYNVPILLGEKIIPHGAMGILVTKEIFDIVGGFDETIELAEDHHFVREAAKHAKFGLFRSVKLTVSSRRFETDGWVKTYIKFLAAGIHMIFRGPPKSDLFKYQFDHYEKKNLS